MSANSITPAPTTIAAFVGAFSSGPERQPLYVGSVGQLDAAFGSDPGDTRDAVVQFFANGGRDAWVVRGSVDDLSVLDAVDVINLLCLPDMRHAPAGPILAAATAYCRTRRAFFIADPPKGLASVKDALAWMAGLEAVRSDLAAIYFPELVLASGRTVAPSGTMAGLYATNDVQRGVWKAPAGTGVVPAGVSALTLQLDDNDNGALNVAGIDALRTFPHFGIRVWGSRTTSRDPDWIYVPVRRLALFLESSIRNGLQWTVFEPNGEALWSAIRACVVPFLTSLWQQGAFMGGKASESFFVQCDATTTPPADVEQGIVNVVIGFAPVRPAEFLILTIQLPAATA